MDELAKERYDLAVERILEIREEKTVAEPYLEFFTKTAGKNCPWKSCAGRIRSAIRIFCRRTTRLPMQVRIMRQRCWEKIWVYC